jgi:predicted transcriptional regulator
MERTLTIKIAPDWKGGLRDAMRKGFAAASYQGETLSFTSPEVFFSKLTSNRWTLVNALQGAGPVGVRELARRVDRDVRRVHGDVVALAELGLLEREEGGAVLCPFANIHIDMHIRAAAGLRKQNPPMGSPVLAKRRLSCR